MKRQRPQHHRLGHKNLVRTNTEGERVASVRFDWFCQNIVHCSSIQLGSLFSSASSRRVSIVVSVTALFSVSFGPWLKTKGEAKTHTQTHITMMNIGKHEIKDTRQKDKEHIGKSDNQNNPFHSDCVNENQRKKRNIHSQRNSKKRNMKKSGCKHCSKALAKYYR